MKKSLMSLLCVGAITLLPACFWGDRKPCCGADVVKEETKTEVVETTATPATEEVAPTTETTETQEVKTEVKE